MFIASKRLLVIGPDERTSRTLARDLCMLCGVEFKSLDQGIIKPLSKPDIVVIGGLRFHDSDTIRKVGRALRAFLDQRVPVLCLMDRPSTRDEVQARAAGVAAVLPTGTPFQDVASRIQSLLRSGAQQHGQAQAARISAVEQVTCSLVDLMAAATSGRVVCPGLASDAGQLLLQALESNSLTNWMGAIGAMHDATYRHSLAIAGVMGAFMLSLGVGRADCQRMVSAALLHDIGKALIPIEIIDKPGPLLPDEMRVMRTHPVLGHELLMAQGGHDDLTLRIVRSHHECLDGTGYPAGLHGDQITDQVRIASMCDVFTALVEPRAYKPALATPEALRIMAGMAGKVDMTLLTAFRRMFAA